MQAPSRRWTAPSGAGGTRRAGRGSTGSGSGRPGSRHFSRPRAGLEAAACPGRLRARRAFPRPDSYSQRWTTAAPRHAPRETDAGGERWAGTAPTRTGGPPRDPLKARRRARIHGLTCPAPSAASAAWRRRISRPCATCPGPREGAEIRRLASEWRVARVPELAERAVGTHLAPDRRRLEAGRGGPRARTLSSFFAHQAVGAARRRATGRGSGSRAGPPARRPRGA